jgi:hypothetical protein
MRKYPYDDRLATLVLKKFFNGLINFATAAVSLWHLLMLPR